MPRRTPVARRETVGEVRPAARTHAAGSAGAPPPGKKRVTPARQKKPARGKAAASKETRVRAALPNRRTARVLLNLEELLARRIVGKDDAIARIARVVRVRMTQLDFRPDRPNGSFLLVGPTGVGKNELAYALAEALLGSESRVISLDLGELAEEADLAKLADTLVPGSKTQAMEGMLTSPVRRDPEAVILFRGLERAHPSFQPVLHQILERGRLEDMLGPVTFSGNIIFVTTRPRREGVGTTEIGFSRARTSPQSALRKRLEKTISCELLDAFNEIIEIPPLSPEAIRKIARYKVEAVLKRLQKRRREIQIDDTVFEAFVPDERGVNREGMGILHRTLEDRLMNPLARYLLSHPQNHSIRIEMVAGNLSIHE